MPTDLQLLVAERMKEARLHAGVRHKRVVSQARMADLVAEYIGRSLHQSQWSDYEIGESDPPLDVLRAAAALSGLDGGYLAALDPPSIQVVLDAAALKAIKEAQRHPEPVSDSDGRVPRALARGAKQAPVTPHSGRALAKKMTAKKKRPGGGRSA